MCYFFKRILDLNLAVTKTVLQKRKKGACSFRTKTFLIFFAWIAFSGVFGKTISGWGSANLNSSSELSRTSLEYSHWESADENSLSKSIETKPVLFQTISLFASFDSQSGLPSDQMFESFQEDKIVTLVRLGLVSNNIFRSSNAPSLQTSRDRNLGDSASVFLQFLATVRTVRDSETDRFLSRPYQSAISLKWNEANSSEGFAAFDFERSEKRKITRYFARLTHSDPENMRKPLTI